MSSEVVITKLSQGMKVKGSGHQPLTKQLKKDWLKMFEIHPRAFGGLLFKPIDNSQDTLPESEVLLFGQLNDHQENEAYADPVQVSIIEVKEGDAFGYVSGEDGEPLGMGESELFMCRISDLVVPDGSVLLYQEAIGDELATRWWYVHSAKQVKNQHLDVGKIYKCIPFGGEELNFILEGEAHVVRLD